MIRKTAYEFLDELRTKILTENVTALAMGSMLFDGEGIRLTEDASDEYVPQGREVKFVETEYAQELSWMIWQFKDGLFDEIAYYDKPTFYGRLADAANAFLQRSDDRTGLMLSVLLEASLMAEQVQQFKNQDLRDEVLACVASLSDVADKV